MLGKIDAMSFFATFALCIVFLRPLRAPEAVDDIVIPDVLRSTEEEEDRFCFELFSEKRLDSDFERVFFLRRSEWLESDKRFLVLLRSCCFVAWPRAEVDDANLFERLLEDFFGDLLESPSLGWIDPDEPSALYLCSIAASSAGSKEPSDPTESSSVVSFPDFLSFFL